MTWIEKEMVIPEDGKLPPDFRAAFGRKARVAVYLPEQEPRETMGGDILSDIVGKLRAFRRIDDPLAWQRNLRASREWRGERNHYGRKIGSDRFYSWATAVDESSEELAG